MDIHHQIIDFLKLTRRLSEQAGDRMLTFLIDMAIEQSADGDEQPDVSKRTVKGLRGVLCRARKVSLSSTK